MIFYFSATGNSLYAARELDPDARSVPQVMRSGERRFRADSTGICAPIYGHEMPDMVKRFIREAEFDTDYLYVILTYGNRHASAVELALEEFRAAGKRVDYIRTLLMADNFLPAFDMDEQRAMDKHVDERIAAIRRDVADKVRSIEPVSGADRRAHASYVKSVHGRPATIWANFDFSDQCIGCGICCKVCPSGCISLSRGRAVRREEGCQACMACIHACPEKAIRMKPTLGFTEKNPDSRYRNEHVSLTDLVTANWQGGTV